MSIVQFFKEMVEGFLSNSPDSQISIHLRRRYWTKQLLAGSCPLVIGRFAAFRNPSNIFFGRSVISTYTIVDATFGEGIKIGDDVSIGPFCTIICFDHTFSDRSKPIRQQGYTGGKIVIEDDVWIGSHVVITKNVTIGRGSVIGAGSVVTHDIPAYSVAAGVPARVIRMR
jgi:acetyltransferase-like isoleucine patch superfamily enzyme